MATDILSLILSAIPDDYDKTTGYITNDFCRAWATGSEALVERLQYAISGLDLDSMTGAVLDDWCYQRKGITRKSGDYATAVLTATVPDGKKATIKLGDIFQTADGEQFESVRRVSVSNGETFSVRSVNQTADANVDAGTITVIPVAITNLTAVTNADQASGGADAEDDAALRKRYLQAIYAMANGSNVGQYEEWAMQIDGVGNALCVPCVDTSFSSSAGECVLLITDTEGNQPTSALIKAVQDVIDPNNNGDGTGSAPMGAKCTVQAPGTFAITIAGTYTGSADSDDVENAIDEYSDSLALEESVFSYSKLMKTILSVDGVEECDITVNSGRVNIKMDDYTIPKLTYNVTHTEG